MLLAALLSWALVSQGGLPLDRARTLYEGASYEEALGVLAGLEASADAERMRAMCLIALGRMTDAADSFDRLIRVAPQIQIGPDDASPRVVELFGEVRRRVLPEVVRDRYARGKASVDRREYERAVADFREVTSLLADPKVVAADSSFVDLRDLAAGFLRLAELEIAMAARVAAPPVVTSRAPETTAQVAAEPLSSPTPEITVTPIVVYSSDDADVRPPVELERPMPPWSPTGAMARVAAYRGEIEVIVDEAGRVEQARIVRPTLPAYDVPLLGATRRWRYRAAARAGVPVKYRLTVAFALSPRQ